MKLTDEQREAIKWAVDQAHIAALGRPLAGVEAQRWLTLRVLLATHPVADAAVAPNDAAEFAELQTFLMDHHADTRPVYPAGLAAWALAALANARRAAFNEAASVDAKVVAMLTATGKVSRKDVDAALEQVAKAEKLPAPTPAVAADAAAPSETCAHDYVSSDRVCTECGEKAAQPGEGKSLCPHCDGEGVIEGDDGISPCACQQDAQEGMPTFGVQKAQPNERAPADGTSSTEDELYALEVALGILSREHPGKRRTIAGLSSVAQRLLRSGSAIGE